MTVISCFAKNPLCCCGAASRPIPLLCLSQMRQDLQLKLFTDYLTMLNKLVMNDAVPIKDQHLHIWSILTHFIFGCGDDLPTHCDHLHELASTSQNLSKSFWPFQTEFHSNMLLFKILHVSTCKNCTRHSRQVHSTASNSMTN
jgi:hypothetical protein